MNLNELGSNFKVSAEYARCSIPIIDLLKTDMTIARCGQFEQVYGMVKHPDFQAKEYIVFRLWLGLLYWWMGDYRNSYKMFKLCEGMTDWSGGPDFRPYWYQAILMKDEIGTWDTWFSALGHFRSGASHLLEKISEIGSPMDSDLCKLYNLYLHGKYSQNGQDTLIEDFFLANPPSSKRFVDIGAYNGITISNTRLLFDLGWSGVCVEPVTSSFNELDKLYFNSGNVVCIHAAIGYKGGPDKAEVEIWDNPSASRILCGDKSPDKKYEEVEVVQANDLLEKLGINEFDFLNIDVENLNLEVLLSLNLAKYRPRLILVEYNGNEHYRHEMIEHMNWFGYRLWHDNLQDLFFCLNDSKSEPAFWNTKTLIPERGK